MPGAIFDGFEELAVRAILEASGISVRVRPRRSPAGWRIASAGADRRRPMPGPDPPWAPRQERLADVELADLTRFGYHPTPRIPQAFGPLRSGPSPRKRSTSNLKPTDPEAVTRKLQEIPGIGDWTAQYIAMRALRRSPTPSRPATWD